MTKNEFIERLRIKLARLPKQEVEERIGFYVEMIDDRMEEGLTEEEAVAAIGSVDEIASQIVADIPLSKIAKENIKPKRNLETWEIVLLVLGFPIWFPLLVAAVSVTISLYVALWSVVISLWAVCVALVACVPAGIVGGIVFACTGDPAAGLVVIAASFVLAGLTIFLFFGCLAATKGVANVTKKVVLAIKKSFIKEEV